MLIGWDYRILPVICNAVTKTVLRIRNTIRSLLAAAFLGLFALAITPKIVLHALAANHIDSHPTLNGHGDQLNRDGFHCQVDNLVVEFPFLPNCPAPGLMAWPLKPVHPAAALEEPLPSSHPLFGLRGPPSLLLTDC